MGKLILLAQPKVPKPAREASFAAPPDRSVRKLVSVLIDLLCEYDRETIEEAMGKVGWVRR